jgi:hypothetical protein
MTVLQQSNLVAKEEDMAKEINFAYKISSSYSQSSLTCRKILLHGVDNFTSPPKPWGISDTDRQNSHSFVHSSYLPQMSVLVVLPESSGGRVRSYPQPASSPWLSMLTYRPGMNSRLVGGCSSETWSHPIIHQSFPSKGRCAADFYPP